MASSSSKRPVPKMVEKKVSPMANNDSDSGGRRHMPSTAPRTSFTPRAEREALNKLKQKMTFSDNSATSSAKSTPTKVVSKHRHTLPHKPSSGRSFLRSDDHMGFTGSSQKKLSTSLPTNIPSETEERSPGYPSTASYTKLPSGTSYTKLRKAEKPALSSSDEGDALNSSVMISNLLSKLDSVKSFLKEAEEMRKKFSDKKSEPGMLAELNKLDKLVEQLQEQESGYLGEILTLMNVDTWSEKNKDEYNSDEEAVADEEQEEEEEEDEDEEKDLDEEEDDPGRAPAHGGIELAYGSGEEENHSLSLRAQMELEQEAKLQLLALQQQKEMLAQLLEKQKQIQDLEAKQADLLQMKAKAEEQLKAAEKKGVELQEEVLLEERPKEASTRERVDVMAKLEELKEKKKRMEQISGLLQTMEAMEEEFDQEEKVRSKKTPSRSRERGRPSGGEIFGVSAQATSNVGNIEAVSARDEMVADDSVHSMDKLMQISHEGSSARKELREAGHLLPRHTEERSKPKDLQQSWKPVQPAFYTRKVEKQPKQQLKNDSPSQVPSEVERSMVSGYEAKLTRKKEEVLQLLKEREELKATHKRLLNLQKKMNIGPILLDPNLDHDVYSQTDVTGATWGGSTVQSDPDEDETSSTSLPSQVEANITQDSVLDNMDHHGGGATIEQMEGKTPPPSIMVTRHTPRVSENVRPRDPSLDSPHFRQQVKKIKMEKDSTPQRPANPLLKSSSAAAIGATNLSERTGGNIFASSGTSRFMPPPGLSTKDQPTAQAPSLFTASLNASAVNQQSAPSATGAATLDWSMNNQQHVSTLQSQLSLTSTMCTQLLEGQNNLIKAVCHRLEQSDVQSNTQDQLAAMQQYQLELETYYHRLCDSYVQLREHQEEEGGDKMPESEEPVSSAAAAQGEEGTPARHRPPPPSMPSAVSFQVEHTDTNQEAGSSHPWGHPHIYASASSKVGDSEVPGAASASFLPPPPPPVSGQFASPGYIGGDNLSSLFNSPPRGLSSSGMRSSQNQFQFEPSPPMLPGIIPTVGYRYPPYGWPMAGRPPWFYPSPVMDSGSGFDPRRQFNNRPSHLGFQPMSQTGRGPGFGTMGSPSGVTACSLQVNAPSSPTSVPSGGMQQGSENASNDNQEPGESALPSAPGAALTGAATAAAATGASGASVGGAVAGGGESEKKAKARQPENADVDSMSSLPLSIPDRSHEFTNEDEAASFLVFDALRDTIYSEVATLIKENENRPHFLVEIFRELQLLTTDYLRQRALYSIQDLVTRFLTEETVGMMGANGAWQESDSESEEDSSRPPQVFDYAEPVHSATSVSTPTEEQPFAVDSLGETVVRLDKAMARLKLAQEQASKDESGELLAKEEVQQEYMPFPHQSEVDTQALDGQIKEIMVEVIPLLKSNIEREFDMAVKSMLVAKIMDILQEQEKDEDTGYLESFRNQVLASITTLLEKYNGKKLKDCGESMLMDISEVLFNELVFLRVMQQSGSRLEEDQSPRLNSQVAREAGDGQGIREATPRGAESAGVRDPPNEVGQAMDSRGRAPKPLDPTLLQLLSASANLTLQEEEDSLGKSRDDNMAVMWDPTIHSHDNSPSDEQELTGEHTSSTNRQPSHISHNNGGVEVYAAIGGVANGLSLSTQENPDIQNLFNKDETQPKTVDTEMKGEATPQTPPTPVPTKSPTSTSEESLGDVQQGASKGEASIEKALRIGKEAHDESETDDQLQPPLSPIATSVSLQEPFPRISSMSESVLESKVKGEQQQTEGVDGILASMKEQPHSADMELVGDEMTTSVNGI